LVGETISQASTLQSSAAATRHSVTADARRLMSQLNNQATAVAGLGEERLASMLRDIACQLGYIVNQSGNTDEDKLFAHLGDALHTWNLAIDGEIRAAVSSLFQAAKGTLAANSGSTGASWNRVTKQAQFHWTMSAISHWCARVSGRDSFYSVEDMLRTFIEEDAVPLFLERCVNENWAALLLKELCQPGAEFKTLPIDEAALRQAVGRLQKQYDVPDPSRVSVGNVAYLMAFEKGIFVIDGDAVQQNPMFGEVFDVWWQAKS
jgi:hypothetical protein